MKHRRRIFGSHIGLVGVQTAQLIEIHVPGNNGVFRLDFDRRSAHAGGKKLFGVNLEVGVGFIFGNNDAGYDGRACVSLLPRICIFASSDFDAARVAGQAWRTNSQGDH